MIANYRCEVDKNEALTTQIEDLGKIKERIVAELKAVQAENGELKQKLENAETEVPFLKGEGKA